MLVYVREFTYFGDRVNAVGKCESSMNVRTRFSLLNVAWLLYGNR